MKFVRKIFLLWLALLFVLATPLQLSADMGPKPIVTVTIVGANRPYWFDLLAEVDEAPVLANDQIEDQLFGYYRDDFAPSLNGYRDADGYASYTLYSSAPHNIDQLEDHVYRVGYYWPPDLFKVVIAFEDGVVITSTIHERIGFNADVTFDLTNVDQSVSSTNAGEISQFIPWTRIGIQYAWRALATILIELGFVYLLGFRSRRTFVVIGLANLATQTILSAFVYYVHLIVSPYYGPFFVIAIGEIIVIAIEFMLYAFLFKERIKRRIAVAAVFGNLITAMLTFLLVFLPL
ncbi:MAG: hypothetical protein MZU97_05720 [Bacillus subtilis]|nr:hypothetical protein [Bacillus subtilis]